VPQLRPAALCAFALLAAACAKPEAQGQPAKEPEPPPVKVKTFAVVERPVPRYLVVTGSLKADREAEIAADAAGKVLATYVERGAPVKKGQPIALLDVRSAELTQAQARQQTRLAQENLELARLECERGQQLYKAGSIPKAELDRRLTQCKTGEWQAMIAETSAEQASKTVRDGTVRAPFSGVIGERFVNIGQYVHPDSRVASIYVVDPLRLELTVPEAQLANVRRGLQVEFRVAAHPENVFEGIVQYVSPIVRQRSRDLVVEAVVKNDKGLLKPGMFAEARLRIAEEKRPVVPPTAVRRGEVAASVFAVVEGHASERVVQLGEAVSGGVAVLAGAKVGDKLVDAPDAALHDGARVQE
jgi:membrane fusion protein (multidrug efflux system)